MLIVKKMMFYLSFIYLGAAGVAQAHPVSFQGATSLMSYNEDNKNEFMLTYSYRSWAAVGVSYLKEQSTDLGDYNMTIPRVNFLLKRWNQEDSQANIYLSAGYGYERSFEENVGVGTWSAEADWESREHYISLQHTFFDRHSTARGRRDDFSITKFRLGFAPYLAEYSEINSWLIVQFTKEADREVVTTPLLRLFYKNVLFELGANLNGMMNFNFMLHL